MRKQVGERALQFIEQFPGVIEGLQDSRLFVTGGTGFIGRYILEMLLLANERYRLRLHICVLSRNPEIFIHKLQGRADWFNWASVEFIKGDVRCFSMPSGMFSHVIHGAHTAASATFAGEDPLVQFDTAASGARRVLDYAAQAGVKRVLMLSSGSVYGPASYNIKCIPEEFPVAPQPQDVSAALSHGKRAAEFQCAYYGQQRGLETVIARCFTFIGPDLPLDIHYAVGNFIRDALWGEEIIVRGDGRAVRSYMDAADLLAWLLVMLVRAPSGAVYNVGSDQAISILELATHVRDLLAPGKPVCVQGNEKVGAGRSVYVPDIARARAELGLEIWTPLDDAIRTTAQAALAAQEDGR